MNPAGRKICVVIPYYQISAGPLVRAVSSILEQRGVERPMVLIVDDASPLPASPIIAGHFPDHHEFIRIIVQKNGGAANARNTALDNLPENTTYVAFLDSDDEWTPDHLANAVRMLEGGCDFYFAGHKRTEWEKDKFAMIGFDPDKHECVESGPGLYEYAGDFIFPVMDKHLVQTSSVVYRKDTLGNLRFPENLVLGEDEVFWVQAMRASRKTGFCRHVEVRMGKGVNISQGGEWGDERSIQLTAQNMRYWRQVAGLFPEERQLETLRKLKLKELRRNLATSVLHRLRRGKRLPLRHIAAGTSADPLWLVTLLTFPFNRNAGKT